MSKIIKIFDTYVLRKLFFMSLLVISWSLSAMLHKNNRFIEASVSGATLIETFGLVQNATYEITQPGVYLFGQDFFFAPPAAMPAIHIKSSGVQLDLNKRTLAQVFPTPGVVGIYVDPDLTGIQIRNGTVLQFTSTAVLFNEGISFISIEDILFKNCVQAALDLVGTALKPISSGIIQRVSMTQSATAGTAHYVMRGSHIDNMFMARIDVNKCGNLTNDVSLLKLAHATECQLLGSIMVNNVGGSLTSFDLQTCEDLIFFETRAVNNSSFAVGGDCIGFKLTDTCKSNIFTSPFVLNNLSTNGNFVGFYLGEFSEGNLFFRTRVIENVGNSASGYRLSGSPSPSNNFNNMIGRTFILRNRAATGDFQGILIDGSDKGLIQRTVIGYNSAPAGESAAIKFELGSGGRRWGIRDCEFIKNTGIDDANSYGIFMQTGTNNIFLQNVAFQNGATPANQLNGVSLGSQEIIDPDSLNLITAPWTNLAVTT